MIRLIVLNNPRLAQAFIDYMASRNIDVNMMPEGGGSFALWLRNVEDQLETEAELKHFLANPNDKKYHAASWSIAESRKSRFKYHTPSMLEMIKAKAGPFTLSIMIIGILVFTLQQAGLGRQIFSYLHFPAVTDQYWQIWRWFSHAVLHFTVLHIVFNMLWWWQLGGDIEQRLGSGKLLQIFAFSALLSGAGQFWVEGANFGGLSGVVYALLGYIWVLGTRAPEKGLVLPRPIVGFMLFWLVLGYVQTYMAIANTAHLIGLLSGIALGFKDSSYK